MRLFAALLGFSLLLTPLATRAAVIRSGSLIKASTPAVYYYGSDGKRYVFPTEKIFFSWYKGFDDVQMITDEELGAIMIGGNVTYRPGVRLVKITTDPKVYAVDANGSLRWVQSEALARALYGEDWSRMVDDIPDPFFVNYHLAEPVSDETSFRPTAARDAATSIDRDRGVLSEPIETVSPDETLPVTASSTEDISAAEPTPVANVANAYHPIPDEFAAAVVYVPATKEFLYEFNADTPRTAASLTKLGMGLAFLGLNPNWSKIVAMSSADEVGGGRLRVDPGAQLSIHDLWFAAIGSSANNAAMALARVSGLGKPLFIERMNQVVKEAGATATTFVEPSGMDPTNMTTARDMAAIANAAFSQSMMRSATSRESYTLAVIGEAPREIKTTMVPFIQDPDVWTLGGKTGYLEESMYNLVSRLRNVDANGQPISGTDVIVVVLGAPTKDGSFASVKRLAQWAWKNHAF